MVRKGPQPAAGNRLRQAEEDLPVGGVRARVRERGRRSAPGMADDPGQNHLELDWVDPEHERSSVKISEFVTSREAANVGHQG